MTVNREELLEIYYCGFNDELWNRTRFVFDDNLSQKAYNLGRIDCICGDDIPSLDYRSEDVIINDILNKNK